MNLVQLGQRDVFRPGSLLSILHSWFPMLCPFQLIRGACKCMDSSFVLRSCKVSEHWKPRNQNLKQGIWKKTSRQRCMDSSFVVRSYRHPKTKIVHAIANQQINRHLNHSCQKSREQGKTIPLTADVSGIPSPQGTTTSRQIRECNLQFLHQREIPRAQAVSFSGINVLDLRTELPVQYSQVPNIMTDVF